MKTNETKKIRHPLKVWVGKFEHYEEIIVATKTKNRAMQLVLPKKDRKTHPVFDHYFEEYKPDGPEMYLWYEIAKANPETVLIYRSPKLKKKKRRDHNVLLLDTQYTLDIKDNRVYSDDFEDFGVNYLDMVKNPDFEESDKD